ncbi:MAG: hypothetical protein HPY50_07005 [Firmicutes bacterium]|nr:hypothetical protein [Bacillota bacterium]
MSLADKVNQMSHLELEELSRLVDQELTRRWKSYEENPQEFQKAIESWKTERLERFIFMSEMEMEYGKHESPPKTLEVARQEMERREKQQQD